MHRFTRFLLTFLCLIGNSCTSRSLHVQRHDSGAKAEDLKRVLINGKQRLVTGTWRKSNNRLGSLEVLSLGEKAAFEPWDIRYNDSQEPLSFTPHGISVVQNSTVPAWLGKDLIYVIDSGKYGKNRRILVFEIKTDHFVFLTSLGGVLPFLDGANSLTALPNGTVYVSIFSPWGKPKQMQPLSQKLSRDSVIPKHSLLRYEPRQAAWWLEITGVRGINGLGYSKVDHSLLVASFPLGEVYRFPINGTLGTLDFAARQTVLPAGYGHPDNLNEVKPGVWLAACSQSKLATSMRFLWESLGLSAGTWGTYAAIEFTTASQDVPPPTVYPVPRVATLPSTVLWHENRLYTSRIFQPGIYSWVPKP